MKSIVQTHALCRTQVDKTRQNRTFHKSLEPAESQGYRHIVNTDVSNSYHLLQYYCGVGRQFLNWSSPGKMRMHCDMTHHQSNRHCKVQSFIYRVKCDCSVQRIGTNTHNLIASKDVTTCCFSDFLHLSRNMYTFFLNKASKVGMLHRTWWLLTLALQVRLYRVLHPKL